MENDERIAAVKKDAESLGYRLLHYSLLGVFIFYKIILRQPSLEISVVLTIWLIIFLIVETRKAIHGVPPVTDRPRHHRFHALFSALVSASVATVVVWSVGITGLWELAVRFIIVFFVVLALFYIWFFIYRYWEKRSLN